MSEFPKLKTGAAAQYPATRHIEYRTAVLRFVDGTEQRYRDSGVPLRRWELSFELVDEEEVERVQELFENSQGSFGSFEFEDPWDGVKRQDCSFELDELEWKLEGESRGQVTLTVRENRN